MHEQQFEPVELAIKLRLQMRRQGAAIAGAERVQPLAPVAAQRLVGGDPLGKKKVLISTADLMITATEKNRMSTDGIIVRCEPDWDLVLAKGYLTSLLGTRVSRYFAQNYREILAEFQKIAEAEATRLETVFQYEMMLQFPRDPLDVPQRSGATQGIICNDRGSIAGARTRSSGTDTEYRRSRATHFSAAHDCGTITVFGCRIRKRFREYGIRPEMRWESRSPRLLSRCPNCFGRIDGVEPGDLLVLKNFSPTESPDGF